MKLLFGTNKLVTNSVSEVRSMKEKIKRFVKKATAVFGAAMAATMVQMTPVLAATNNNNNAGGGTASVTAPLDNLKTLVIAIIGAVGVIILAKNVMEFAQAYQQQDSSTMNSALKGIVAGVMMASISAVLTFLGF